MLSPMLMVVGNLNSVSVPFLNLNFQAQLKFDLTNMDTLFCQGLTRIRPYKSYCNYFSTNSTMVRALGLPPAEDRPSD